MKCENCADPLAKCGDCGKAGIVLNWQEAQDCISAIGVWKRQLDQKKNPQTFKALIRLEKKLWKLKSS